MSSPLFHFTQRAGAHPVGLKVVEQYDYSRAYRSATDELGRPYLGERARPLQTLIWYPAEASSAPPMRVNDYLNLWATETSFGEPRMPAWAIEWRSGMSPTLETSLWAVRDTPLAPGRFPVVIYAPSHSAPSWENADLCEYLASHGYVVIASPCMGAASRRMTSDVAGARAQARDISFLIGYAQTLPNADLSEVAVVGFSWGGISNLFAAARDNRITALVALDGSLRFSPGLVHKAGDVHPERMTIPLLSIAQGQWTPEDRASLFDRYPEYNGPDVLNAWTHGDLITVHMLGLSHMEHSAMFQRNEDIWWCHLNVYQQKKADYSRADGITGYAWLARYTLNFLNAYLKRDGASMGFLKRTPAENGAPRRFMTISYRAAIPMRASPENFRKQLNHRGFERAADIYAEFQKQRADFKIEEELLSAWSEELINGSHLAEAVALLKLNVQHNPDSSAALTSLGRAYRKLGQGPLAIESFKSALQKNPADAEARRNLKELDESG